MVLLILTGCSNKSSKSINNQAMDEVTDRLDLSNVLKGKQILDYKLANDNFIAVIVNQGATGEFVYSLKDETVLLENIVSEDPIVAARVIILDDGFAISYDQNTRFNLYDNEIKLIRTVDLSNYKQDSNLSNPIAISHNLNLIAFMKEFDTLSILNLSNDEVNDVLVFNHDEVNKLINITDLAFLDLKTLVYCGGVYLKAGDSSSSCYGTIDLSTGNYNLINSGAIEISAYRNQVLVHNHSEGYGSNTEKMSYLYNGKDGKALNLSLEDSCNAIQSSDGIVFLSTGSADDNIKPEIKIRDKQYTSFNVKYSYITNCEIYQNKMYLYGYIDSNTKIFSVEEII